jgi:hypothetical protein
MSSKKTAAAATAETKRKGKKIPKVVAVVTPEGIEGSFLPEPRRPLIAHLQINASEINFHDMPIQYDPNPPHAPEPYDAVADNMFNEMNAEVIQESKAAALAPVVEKSDSGDKKPIEAFYKAELMVAFKDCEAGHKLPNTTPIACFWCAHSFETMPCVIPEREEKGVYRVYGNFCCPECAMAYLLSENLDTHVRWERMALLNRIYHKRNLGAIYPAPPRESLAHFGGVLTIEQYRNTIREGKVRVDIQMPPMVSILGSMDTKPIDFYNSSLKNTISPLLNESISKAEEGLRLRRSKPLKERESTLDVIMNIQFKGKKGGAN